jgi:hypothetical protein
MRQTPSTISPPTTSSRFRRRSLPGLWLRFRRRRLPSLLLLVLIFPRQLSSRHSLSLFRIRRQRSSTTRPPRLPPLPIRHRDHSLVFVRHCFPRLGEEEAGVALGYVFDEIGVAFCYEVVNNAFEGTREAKDVPRGTINIPPVASTNEVS